MSIFSVLTKILPPPSFISMPSVGIDISDTSLKYVSFYPTQRKDNYRILDQWGNIDIKPGALERGEITDPKALVDALREFKSVTEAEYVRVSLPEERAYIFETEIKRDVPINEIKSLLEFRMEENVPIPARDTVFDYDVFPSAQNKNMSVVVVAAYQRETVLKYYDVCREVGLTPLSFEVEAQAMGRAVIAEDDTDVVMLLDFGKTRTGVGIVSDKALRYTSTIDIGGSQLSNALKKAQGDLPEEELTAIKNNFGLICEKGDTSVCDSLISTISVIKDEIALRMQYWHQRPGGESRRIKKIVICGGSGNLRGLPEYLTELLGVKCTRGNVWENAFDTSVVVPPIDRQHSYGYATAVGLALKNSV